MRLIIMTMTSLLLCHAGVYAKPHQNIVAEGCELSFGTRPLPDQTIEVPAAKRPWSRTYFCPA